MSLVEVVKTPSGESFCLEAYSVHSIGGWLRHPEEPPGDWRIDVFRWPVALRRGPHWSVIVPSKQDAERRVRELIALLEQGDWSPHDGGPPL